MQERKRLKEQFPRVDNDDESEMRQLLDAYNNFVLHGSPPSNDYPLSLDAYSNRKKSNRDVNNDSAANCQKVNDNGACCNDDKGKNHTNDNDGGGDDCENNRETDR